jgi:hypothetical protein
MSCPACACSTLVPAASIRNNTATNSGVAFIAFSGMALQMMTTRIRVISDNTADGTPQLLSIMCRRFVRASFF